MFSDSSNKELENSQIELNPEINNEEMTLPSDTDLKPPTAYHDNDDNNNNNNNNNNSNNNAYQNLNSSLLDQSLPEQHNVQVVKTKLPFDGKYQLEKQANIFGVRKIMECHFFSEIKITGEDALVFKCNLIVQFYFAFQLFDCVKGELNLIGSARQGQVFCDNWIFVLCFHEAKSNSCGAVFISKSWYDINREQLLKTGLIDNIFLNASDENIVLIRRIESFEDSNIESSNIDSMSFSISQELKILPKLMDYRFPLLKIMKSLLYHSTELVNFIGSQQQQLQTNFGHHEEVNVDGNDQRDVSSIENDQQDVSPAGNDLQVVSSTGNDQQVISSSTENDQQVVPTGNPPRAIKGYKGKNNYVKQSNALKNLSMKNNTFGDTYKNILQTAETTQRLLRIKNGEEAIARKEAERHAADLAAQKLAADKERRKKAQSRKRKSDQEVVAKPITKNKEQTPLVANAEILALQAQIQALQQSLKSSNSIPIQAEVVATTDHNTAKKPPVANKVYNNKRKNIKNNEESTLKDSLIMEEEDPKQQLQHQQLQQQQQLLQQQEQQLQQQQQQLQQQQQQQLEQQQQQHQLQQQQLQQQQLQQQPPQHIVKTEADESLVTKGSGKIKQAKRTIGKQQKVGLLSILEQNSRQLQIMHDRIQFLETGGRTTSSYSGHYVGEAAGRNTNNTTISTPLIDRKFQTPSDINATTQKNGYNITNNESSQSTQMVMVPQQLFYTPQGQPYYAQPTPSPMNMMAQSQNNWQAANTPQGIMYQQQQAIQQQGYNHQPNNMFDYALLDFFSYYKKKHQ